jgi:hypothetical protein
LTAHYDGVNNKTMTKDEAYNLIQTSQYMGKKRHFNFEKYLMIHIKAHQDLADNGEPLPKSRKVREFLDHINCNEMEAGVAMYLLMKARVRTSLQLQITFHSLLASRCLSVRQKTEGDQLDQHPERTEVEGVEDADLDKEEGDAEVLTAEVNKIMGNPRREVLLLLTPCGQNCHQLFSQ